MTTIGLGVIIALGSITFAQDRPVKQHKHIKGDKKNKSPEERAKQRTDRMTKQLDLSEAQAEKIYVINLELATELKKIRAEIEKTKGKAKAKRVAMKSEIEKILTDEQKEKAKQLKAKRNANKKVNHSEHTVH